MRIFTSGIAKVLKTAITNFADAFYQRSNTTTGLGTATDGNDWIPVSQLINVVSGKATANTTPTANSTGSAYPMSVVEMADSDVEIRIKDTNQGSAAAIWVQSADEWWMVNVRGVLTEIPGNANYGVVGSNYGVVGSNYGQVGTNYVWTGDNYGVTGYYYYNASTSYSNYYYTDGANVNYYSTFVYRNTSYSVTNYSYGYNKNSTTNYSSGYYYAANYGVKYTKVYGYIYSNSYNKYTYGGTAYNSSTTYTTAYKFVASTSTYTYNFLDFSYYSSVSWYYYGPVASTYSYNYTVQAANFGDVGDNYGPANANYGVVGSNYGEVGSNYGQTGTNATTYSFAQYLDISKSVASVVSTVTSALISTSQTIKSIFVGLSGNQITAKAYSDTNLVTQIGSDLVYTATGATIFTQYGIAISTSQYDQSAIIGSEVTIDVV